MDSFKIDSLIRSDLIHNPTNLQHCIDSNTHNLKQINSNFFKQKKSDFQLIPIDNSKALTNNLEDKNNSNFNKKQQFDLQNSNSTINNFSTSNNNNSNNNNVIQFLMNYATNSNHLFNKNITEKKKNFNTKTLINNNNIVNLPNLNQMIIMPQQQSLPIFENNKLNLTNSLCSNNNNKSIKNSNKLKAETTNHQNVLYNQKSIFLMPQLFGASTSSTSTITMPTQMDSDNDSIEELYHNSKSVSPSNSCLKNQSLKSPSSTNNLNGIFRFFTI